MRNWGDDQQSGIFKADETTIKEMIDCWG